MRPGNGCVPSHSTGNNEIKYRFRVSSTQCVGRSYTSHRSTSFKPFAVTGSSSSCNGKVTSTLQVRVATPVDYWACADINVRVFYAGTHRDTARRGSASSSSDSDSEDQLASSTKHLLSDVKRVLDTLERVDSVQTFTTNDEIQARGYGKHVILVAYDPSTSVGSSLHSAANDTITTSEPLPGSEPASSSSTQGTNSLSGSVHTAASPASPSVAPGQLSVMAAVSKELKQGMIPAHVKPGVGQTAEDRGLKAMAILDSFCDKVPPRSLDLLRDGALGTLKRDGIAYISNVAVLESCRRQGAARKLVVAAENMATEWGCRAMGLHCNPHNVPAMRLYESMGYRRTGILEPPWVPWLMGRPPTRCVFMIKRLPTTSNTTSSTASSDASTTTSNIGQEL